MAGLYRFRPRSYADQARYGIVCSTCRAGVPDNKIFYFAETWESSSPMTMTSRLARSRTSASSSTYEASRW